MTATARAPAATTWQPRIVALVCNWCTYTGADMAGTARRTYSPSVRAVRLPCTGRMDPLFILKAFEEGADGVIVSGCHPGDCHYTQGNLHARRRLSVFENLMGLLGLDRRRLHLAWVSASEGLKWARVVDEATEKVREVGPIGVWPRADAPVAATPSIAWPPPPAEPRQPSDPAVIARVAGHLREVATRLLIEEQASVVVGYTADGPAGRMLPAFATTPEEAESLDWNERCVNNLAVYLPEAVRRARGRQGRVAVVVKTCDARAVAGLLREHQLAREDVALIGAACDGMRSTGRLASKCHACAQATTPLADWTVTADGAVEGAVAGPPRPTGPDPRATEVEALRALPAAERWSFWQSEFDRCLRCYACRAVCPLCYCPTCVVEKHRPQWVPVAHGGAGNTAWNVVRAMHLAGRCADCDECARACPVDIRLDLLNRAVAADIEERFGFTVGADPEVAAALTTFRPDDTDGFL